MLAAAIACAACGTRERAPPTGATPPSTRHSHGFRKVTLYTEFTCEGASHGDFNRDGVQDVVAGPYW